jgi:serine/threonine-protein kinase RsbT
MAAQAINSERLNIQKAEDIVIVRQTVRAKAQDLGFSLVDQTKMVTAASELARNTLVHGGGGWVYIQVVENGIRRGVKMIFEDNGPGIADVEKALQDGFTTGSGLGLGLGGARRLSNEFEISSQPGQGTRIAIIRWKP